ncbi:hypothetical protein [Faecalibaculum rodentium]|nr:hypothetical protein [Faecalibaculum rodentium]
MAGVKTETADSGLSPVQVTIRIGTGIYLHHKTLDRPNLFS